MTTSYDYNKINHRHIGPLLSIILIALLIILGGLYIWGNILFKKTLVEETIINNEPETPRAAADVQILQILSPSDELEAISADLDGTNFDTLEADINTAIIELDAALR